MNLKATWASHSDLIVIGRCLFQVKAPSGEILYSKLVDGNGNLPGIQLAAGENAKIALKTH
ncbi:MAG TPA: hypothetical protein VFK65_09420 [Candidatus Binatia bacterium]|nr:hypothetical protein [Candidatus Binatia bacterium]